MKVYKLMLASMLLVPVVNAGVVTHAAKDTGKVAKHTAKDVKKAGKALFKLVW